MNHCERYVITINPFYNLISTMDILFKDSARTAQ